MAVVPLLALSTPNRLFYRLTASASGTVTIPNTATAGGGATPNLAIDASAGPIRAIAFGAVNGIGGAAPGALTQAQARALLLSDASTPFGGPTTPRASCEIYGNSGAGAWDVDANVNGSGDPVIVCTVLAAGAAVGYLKIDSEAAIG